ncbi:MAG: hypothetical protein HOQ24_15845, partial [Mycobacteriaceae bacterium]|nr:hypothetical protein [Mycobacteriaceae bacterium]
GVAVDRADLPAMIDRYRKGQVVVEPAFTSASTKPQAGNVVFVISSKSGRDISPFSAFEGEGEVLFRPGTAFKVRSVNEKNNAWVIRLTEVDPPR